MSDTTAIRLSPGDVVRVETDAGPRFLQVTHCRPPYPDVVRAIAAGPHDSAGADDPAAIAARPTAFSAMAELGQALARGELPGTVIGTAPVPKAAADFPTFRMPIRDRSGRIVYWWTWDGEGLAIAPEAGDTELPLREVTAAGALATRLASLRTGPVAAS